MERTLSAGEKDAFERDGYLILSDLLTPAETADLQSWAQEVHDWPNEEHSPWMAYAEINAQGKQVLCRTENYAASHQGLNALLRGDKLLGVLRQLSGEDMVLFKEKINYKLAGSGGFAAHIDATAYTHVKKIQHLAILLAVDASTPSNGGLEVVPGSHKTSIPLGDDNCISPSWISQQDWLPITLAPGQVLIFGSYLAHRSGANTSEKDRKALYATYNVKREGDLHDEYYARRKVEFPPTHLRKKGDRFDEGAMRYAYGSPMLSVELGKQLVV